MNKSLPFITTIFTALQGKQFYDVQYELDEMEKEFCKQPLAEKIETMTALIKTAWERGNSANYNSMLRPFVVKHQELVQYLPYSQIVQCSEMFSNGVLIF